jgi:phosphoglycolate phosphatase
MLIKNIIFDWSGTLSDDFESVYAAIMFMFKQLGREPITEPEFRQTFTLPYMNFWHKYFPDLAKERQDRLFIEALSQVGKPKLFPGVKKMLNSFFKQNMEMVIFSSHPQAYLEEEVKINGIQEYFQEIIGNIHNKTEAIMEIMQRNGFDPQDTVIVGDMPHDIEAGKQAKIITVAIQSSYQDAQKLPAAHPDYLLTNINDFLRLLANI